MTMTMTLHLLINELTESSCNDHCVAQRSRSLHVLFISLLSVLIFAPQYASATPDQFWRHWSDGQAEVSAFRITQPRYGQNREGLAFLIYVTEPFSKGRSVKIDRYDRDNPDHTIALKLNRIEEWRTGMYKYRLMTSHFFDTQDQLNPLKSVFSSQEWCGVTYEEFLWDRSHVDVSIKSYFDGESAELRLSKPHHLIDSLWMMGRGLMVGGPQKVRSWPTSWIESSKRRRLKHRPLKPFDPEPQWENASDQMTSQSGDPSVSTLRFRRASQDTCRLKIQNTSPYQVIGWRCDRGERATLLGSARMPYWNMSKLSDTEQLKQLGVTPAMRIYK